MNSYYTMLKPERIKNHGDDKLILIEEDELRAQLNSFLLNVDTCSIAVEYNSIDTRVCIDFCNAEGQVKSIYLDRWGKFFINGRVYKRNEKLNKLIEKYIPEKFVVSPVQKQNEEK